MLEDVCPFIETERGFPAWMVGGGKKAGGVLRQGHWGGGKTHLPRPPGASGPGRKLRGQEQGVGRKQGAARGERSPEVHRCREVWAG